MKRTMLFVLAIIMVFTLAACKVNEPSAEGSDGVNKNPVEDNNPGEDNNTVDSNPEDKIMTVKLYFANNEYIMTGDDSEDSVIAIEREVKVGDKTIEEIILEELKNKPEDEQLTTIIDKIEILSVEIRENTAYVDVSSEDLHGSSTEESLILQQIVYSLTELKQVDQVQFLVDGSKCESLMGHIFIEEPLEGLDVK